MRACGFAVMVALAASLGAVAEADDGVPVAGMHVVIDRAAVCNELRAAWGPDLSLSSCKSVISKTVRGVGKVDIWQAGTHGDERWALSIEAGHDLWVSPELTFPGDDCGAGHCHELVSTPFLRTIHPRGRVAVALEVQTAERWYANESQHQSNRGGTGVSFILCGITATAEWRCATEDGRSDSQACSAKLADTGTITRRCEWSEPVDLGAN
jgi:hypothetical protein